MIRKFKIIAFIFILFAVLLTVILAGRVQNFINLAAEPDRKLAIGVSLPNQTLGALDAFAKSAGRYPATFSIWNNTGDYGGTSDGQSSSFPSKALLNGLDQRGITPVIFMQPVGGPIHLPKGANPNAPPDRAKLYSNSSFAAGNWDSRYFIPWANAAAAYGKPLIVRYAQEMNGHWFPWSVWTTTTRYYNVGNTPGNYVAAWRHVHDVITSRAPNVKFLWTPYGIAPPAWYPGNNYVEFVGFDSYNSLDKNQSMENLYRPAVRQLNTLTNGTKKIIVGETGVDERFSKDYRAAWLTNGFSAMLNYPNFTGIIYFNFSQWYLWGGQHPIDSAWRSLVSQPQYQGRLFPTATPTPTPRPTAKPSPTLIPKPPVTLTPSPAPTKKPIVGIIRYDAWTPNQLSQDSTKPNPVGIVQLSSDFKWHYRLPFFADENNKTFAINEDKQETIDQEILFTSQAGIDYWAFDWYNFWWQNNNPSWHYNYGLNYYLNSPYKSRMNFALTMMCCGGVEHYPSDWKTVFVPKLINLVKEPTYQKVLNGRPLIYMFGASNLRGWFNCGFYDSRYGTCADTNYASSSAALKFLRDKVQEAGLPNPYLVAMVWDSLNKNYTSSTGYGFDAISSYSGHNANIDGLTQKTYQDLANDNIAYRERAKTAENKIIPPVNSGWDRRPDPDYNKVWYDAGTPQQVGANLKAAIDWNSANPTLAETNNILIYAWNEFTEGGWLGPTIEDRGARLNAIADVLGGIHVTPIPTKKPSPTPKPSLTPRPSSRPTSRPTQTPTLTPTPTPTPRISLTPTPTLSPGTTVVNLSVGLDGIGTTPRIPLGGNKNPLRRTRNLEIKIYKASDNSLVFSESQVFSFNSSTNRFDAAISLPPSFETGIYNLYVLGSPFLTARYPGSITVTKGEAANLSSESFSLITGNINNIEQSKNLLNILDYNILVFCSIFKPDQSSCSQNPDYKTNSDLNDNGTIDQDDLTLLIKEMGNQSGDSLPGD